MPLRSFSPSPSNRHDTMPSLASLPIPGGAGNSLPLWLLVCCGVCTAVATGVSIMSITLQLKNYRKPPLQRAVVRIMLMVPLYAISSLIAIFSLEAAFFIDAVRDLYEAFVIYTFFQLLITYLGGERSLLIILHGRPPIPHPFPFNIFLSPMDVSDPWTLLNLKRGVLQYVQIKPLLVVATIILKLTGTYREGNFSYDSGYTYISIVYNTSICLSLYCLAMFWVAVNHDLKPFRPVPKFLCVKGILFFTFWQSLGISWLVAIRLIKKVGPYDDAEHMSLALVDSLICFEMPIFALAHQYAFRADDYIDETLLYAARLPFIYAFRDAFGLKDVWEDTKDTLRGRGVSYQAYEPAEGTLHYGKGRQRRIRAGLRYSKGGKAKYWVPIPGDEARFRGERGPISAIKRKMDERLAAREGYAPLLPKQAANVVHQDPENQNGHGSGDRRQTTHWGYIAPSDSEESDAPSLDFHSADDDENGLYERARRIGYAGCPNVDVSKERRRKMQRLHEEEILRGRRTPNGNGSMSRGSASSSGDGKGKGKASVYGAWADRVPSFGKKGGSGSRPQNGGPSEAWEYDGDNERPDAWRPDGSGSEEQMRWTKQQHRQASKPNGLAPPASSGGAAKFPSRPSLKDSQHSSRRSRGSRSNTDEPFALGASDSASESGGSGSDAPSLPPDAVDLVVEDEQAREQARQHERRKGEPQTNAPAHVFRAARSRSDLKVPKVQEVYDGDSQDVERRNSIKVKEEEAPTKSPVDQIFGSPSKGGGVAAPTLKTYDSGVDHAHQYQDDDNPWA